MAPLFGPTFNGRGSIFGLSLENPRAYIEGPVLRLRYAMDFSSRVFPGEAGRRTDALSLQPTLLVGPFRQVAGLYGIVSPGVGIDRNHDRDWRGFFSPVFGAGLGVRTGQRVNVYVEVIHHSRNFQRGFWAAAVRMPIYPFF